MIELIYSPISPSPPIFSGERVGVRGSQAFQLSAFNIELSAIKAYQRSAKSQEALAS